MVAISSSIALLQQCYSPRVSPERDSRRAQAVTHRSHRPCTKKLRNLPLFPREKRADAARKILYGPDSNMSIADMHIDEVSPTAIKTQSSAAPLESWWAGGTAPMLVLQGLHDVHAPPENGRSLKQDYPDRVTLVEFPDLGHAIARERPDLVSNAIVAWATKLGQ